MPTEEDLVSKVDQNDEDKKVDIIRSEDKGEGEVS